VQQCQVLVPTKYDPLILSFHSRYAPLLIKLYKFIIQLHVLGRMIISYCKKIKLFLFIVTN